MIKKNLNKNIENSSISIAKNSQFDIRIIDTFTSGIVLSGNEIKSLRLKNVSIKESYILCKNSELYIFNMYIAPYKNANVNVNENVDCRLKRKLLMKKSEIRKIHKQSREKGYIIHPIKIFINERGWAKLELSLAQKLRKHQIKINIKEREIKRKIQKNDFF
ncbi:MAG: SsrA-binding protein [Mycoplasmataceae bacterium]|nr:MAG: SsrA-binding protein [Mycoplasmataceae bacterium]